MASVRTSSRAKPTNPPAGIDEPQLTPIPCEADKKGNFEPAKSDGSKKAIGKSRLC